MEWRSGGALRRTGLLAAGLGLAAGLLGLGGCIYPMPRQPLVVPRLEVQAPEHLTVTVAGMRRRPLAAAELTPLQRAGYHWEYQVRFAETRGVGLRLELLRMTVRSLSGTSAHRVQSLPSRVEPFGTTPISIEAFLSTSDPGAAGDLSGVHELLFAGTDDRGGAVQVSLRVPLE